MPEFALFRPSKSSGTCPTAPAAAAGAPIHGIDAAASPRQGFPVRRRFVGLQGAQDGGQAAQRIGGPLGIRALARIGERDGGTAQQSEAAGQQPRAGVQRDDGARLPDKAWPLDLVREERYESDRSRDGAAVRRRMLPQQFDDRPGDLALRLGGAEPDGEGLAEVIDGFLVPPRVQADPAAAHQGPRTSRVAGKGSVEVLLRFPRAGPPPTAASRASRRRPRTCRRRRPHGGGRTGLRCRAPGRAVPRRGACTAGPGRVDRVSYSRWRRWRRALVSATAASFASRSRIRGSSPSRTAWTIWELSGRS